MRRVGESPVRAPTWVITLVTGAILAFAVSGNPDFLDVHRAGVILIVTGVAGLWALGGKAWLLVGRARLQQLLDQTPPMQGTRVPLDDLLRPAPEHPRGSARDCRP